MICRLNAEQSRLDFAKYSAYFGYFFSAKVKADQPLAENFNRQKCSEKIKKLAGKSIV